MAPGQRRVVREVARLLLDAEDLAAQVHRQDEVCLFDDLLAIEVEVGEVQEQRVLVGGGGGEIPHLMFCKGLVLWGHAEAGGIPQGTSPRPPPPTRRSLPPPPRR